MARTDPQVNLRMPADLKERLEVTARENNRSLTAEIVARLEGSFDPSSEGAPAKEVTAILDLLRRIQAEVTRLRIKAGSRPSHPAAQGIGPYQGVATEDHAPPAEKKSAARRPRT
ncbi:Arc family DNA-binding protein [Cupriavidus sp. JZ107]